MPPAESHTIAPRQPLSRSSVVATAMALADDVGYASLSMRKLAEALGVEAMSLYHHIKNKEDLLDAMVDQVFAEIDLPPMGEPWRSATAHRAGSARNVLARHPWAIVFLDSRSTPGLATLTHHDAALGCLRNAGFSLVLTAHAVSVIDSYVHGFAMAEAAMPFRSGAEAAELAEVILDEVPAGAYPHLGEIATDHVMVPGYDYGAEFDYGLDLILDGLAAALQAET